MRNSISKKVLGFIFTFSLLLTMSLCVGAKSAQASGSRIFYNNHDLKKLGFKNVNFPRKLQGTWYFNGFGDMYKLRIHGNKLTIPAIPLPVVYFAQRTNTFKVNPKAMTVKKMFSKGGKVTMVKRRRFATYNKDQGLIYIGVSGNKLTFGPAYVSSKNWNKPTHKLVRIVDGEYNMYRTKKLVLSHLRR